MSTGDKIKQWFWWLAVCWLLKRECKEAKKIWFIIECKITSQKEFESAWALAHQIF